METRKLFLCFICLAIIGCKGQDSNIYTITKNAGITFEEKQKQDISNIIREVNIAGPESGFNFRSAAKKVTHSVVHIKSTYSVQGREFLAPLYDDFWHRFFYDGEMAKPQADASGVIVSSDGYIVTNDHVVEGAENIEIILNNKKKYTAKVVGLDPETDLALLKIEENKLSFIEFGNSDEVEVGDWVLEQKPLVNGDLSRVFRSIKHLQNKTLFIFKQLIVRVCKLSSKSQNVISSVSNFFFCVAILHLATFSFFYAVTFISRFFVPFVFLKKNTQK